MSADPLGVTPLRLIDPQRWNQYTYALGNPLSYIDPDGQDALAIVFSNMAVGMGHLAAVSIEADGTATYGDFGPAGGSKPLGTGEVRFQKLDVKVSFDENRNPTNMKDIIEAVSKMEGTQATSSIKAYYFKTSSADALRMKQWMENQYYARSGWETYIVGINDCRDFTWGALGAGGVSGFVHHGETPNSWMQWMFDWWVDKTSQGQREGVDHKIITDNVPPPPNVPPPTE